MKEACESGPVAVMLEDSADARLFVELSSYAADIVEAREALRLAARVSEEDSGLVDAAAYLINCAVVAYCRTIQDSNVRGRLTEHVEIPGDLADTHELIRGYRNTTVAHSQSEFSIT